MAARPFRNPLLAKIDDTSHYAARSAWEALEFLQCYWRGPHDRSYKVAVHLCRDAIDGWVPAERARAGFKQASQSAGLLVSKRGAALAPDIATLSLDGHTASDRSA